METKKLYYRKYTYYINSKQVNVISMYDCEFYGSLYAAIQEEESFLSRTIKGKYLFLDGKYIADFNAGDKYEFCVTEFVKYTPKQLKTLGRL